MIDSSTESLKESSYLFPVDGLGIGVETSGIGIEYTNKYLK